MAQWFSSSCVEVVLGTLDIAEKGGLAKCFSSGFVISAFDQIRHQGGWPDGSVVVAWRSLGPETEFGGNGSMFQHSFRRGSVGQI